MLENRQTKAEPCWKIAKQRLNHVAFSYSLKLHYICFILCTICYLAVILETVELLNSLGTYLHGFNVR